MMVVLCILLFGQYFTLLPPQQPKKSKLKTLKKPGDIIISHMCTKNYDHMVYGSRDMVDNGWTNGWTHGWKK